jgi:hypothetical protein
VDRYEASRPDATADDAGSDERYILSRDGVLPWTNIDEDAADAACDGDGTVPGKILCTGAILEAACEDNYPYGAAYAEGSCNDSTTHPGLAPTGTFTSCCTDRDVCDLSGNAAELFAQPFVATFGGHSQDSDQAILSCDHTAGPDFAAADANIGFRCCSLPRD